MNLVDDQGICNLLICLHVTAGTDTHEILAKLEPLTEAAALTIHGIEGVMDRLEGLEVRSGMIMSPCLLDFLCQTWSFK